MATLNVEANRAFCATLFNRSRYNVPKGRTCRPDFDDSLCWEETELDDVVGQPCPFKFCSDCTLPEADRYVTRHCLLNGTWSEPNYDQCVFIFYNTSCIQKDCSPCADPFRQMLMGVTLALSVMSVFMLIVSVSLFSWLKSIQCRRLTIHANLALAFVLRFATYIVWILLQRDQVMQGCTRILNKETGDYLCKIILFLIMYSTLASTFWMFVEGAYLVSRFSIYAMRATDGPLWLYLLVGWVAPFVFVSLWALSLELQQTVQFCWVPYTTTWAIWFLVGPMSTALILNVLFLVVVIVVVIQKMHTSRSTESAKIWQTIKSTLLLVPLLGVSNLLLFYEPSERETLAFQVYLLVTAVLQHSQGIFVAILYCFANGEVQVALKREVKKLNLSTRHLVHKSSNARSFTMYSSNADNCVTPNGHSGSNPDQKNVTSPDEKRKNNNNQCNQNQRRLNIRNVSKVNVLDKMTSERKTALTNNLTPATPFFSKNSPLPIRPHYQSCVVYRNDAPKVIITGPDDE